MTANKELMRHNTLEYFRTLVSQHDPPSGDDSNGNFREGQASKDKQPQEERQTQASRCQLANDTSIPKNGNPLKWEEVVMTKASIEDIVLDTLDLSTIGSHMKRKRPSANSGASSSTIPTNLS